MGIIFFLSKSQNFFTLPLAQKMVFAKKKKKKGNTVATAKGCPLL